jgi:AraC-like DNA-binding protein
LEDEAMNERPGYGDAEAKRIIARAAEIDAEQGRRLDAPALREIAAEAGISPLAVDRALEEHESSAMTQVSWLKRHRALVTIAAITAALLLLAFVSRMSPQQP